METKPDVLLSAIIDEAVESKEIETQMMIAAALGLEYYTLRFVDVLGRGQVQNVMQLVDWQLQYILSLQEKYGLKLASVGSPIGKSRLWVYEDDQAEGYMVPSSVLDQTKRGCDIVNTLGGKILRGFTFYIPKGERPEDCITRVVDKLGPMAEICEENGVVYAAEVEARLVGRSGVLLANIAAKMANPCFMTCPDLANIYTQGYSAQEVQYEAGQLVSDAALHHMKDYDQNGPMPKEKGKVDENALKHFVPVDIGGCNHRAYLGAVKAQLPRLQVNVGKRGIPGVILDAEPHVKGGGQFGGWSGPDGMGVAVRALCRVCDEVGLSYHLRDFSDIRKARGF